MNARNTVLSVVCLLIVGSGTERVYGVALFQTAQTFSTGAPTSGMAVGDMNGDRKPDIIVFNQSTCVHCDGNVAILLGNGDGTFQAAKTFDSGLAEGAEIAVADLNGDSKLDVVVLVTPVARQRVSASSLCCSAMAMEQLVHGTGTRVKGIPAGPCNWLMSIMMGRLTWS